MSEAETSAQEGEAQEKDIVNEAETETVETSESEEKTAATVTPISREEESFKDKYLRTRADLENIQRRMREERSHLRVTAIANFTKELLPFIDNLDRAIVAAGDVDNEMVQGLKMSRSQLDKILEANNIKKAPSEGLFNANFHEAVMQVENTELPNNSIQAVLETGYVLGDRVIRYSKVQVTTGGPEAEEGQ